MKDDSNRSLINPIGLAVVIVLFLLPYVALFGYVGVFPAEDLGSASPDSTFRKILCLDGPVSDGLAANSDSQPGANDRDWLPRNPIPQTAPEISFNPARRPIPEKITGASDSLYFSERTHKIIAIDAIDKTDAGILWMLALQHSVPANDLAGFKEKARLYYPPCNVPVADRGVTEGYWAAKGTSVLHHWVHLYEATEPGDPKLVQYGYLVPWMAKAALEGTSTLGPTNFVRAAWVLFAVCGLLYIFIFLKIFPRHRYLAIAGLLIKIICFLNIGKYILVLAPGFHWFRELVFISVALISVTAIRQFAGGGRSVSRARATGLFAGAAACYLLDPLFFMISATCFLAAFCWSRWDITIAVMRLRKKLFLSGVFAAIAAAIAIGMTQSDKFLYIIDKLMHGDYGLFGFTPLFYSVVAGICLVAAIVIALTCNRRNQYLLIYFSFLTLVSSLYFFITPDHFHFMKFIEYATPLGIALVVSLEPCFRGRLFSSPPALSPLRKIAPWGLLLMLTAMSLVVFIRKPGGVELRLTDSFDAPYVVSRHHEINNRMIDADMPEELAEHLRMFPREKHIDFIVSPYDKYIAFLYDVRNGFADPDLAVWLDSNERLDETIQQTAAAAAPVDVLVDDAALSFDPRMGLKASHSWLGPLQKASKIYVKDRLRTVELATTLLRQCTKTDANDPPKGGWQRVRCGGPGRSAPVVSPWGAP